MKKIKTHVRKGDLVEVIIGDHKGARGNIIAVRRHERQSKVRVLVEGVNMVKKAVKPTQEKPQGGFLEKEAPIHISNVKLIERTKAKPVERKK
jgi:large subunit ribosomal protein L24